MQNYNILKTNSGIGVYVDLVNSKAGRSVSHMPHILNLIKEALPAINFSKPDFLVEHDMGRIIGTTEIVKTKEDDVIFYAQGYKETVFSRFVKNRNLLPSSRLSMHLRKDPSGDYELLDVWIGPLAPPFPGDKKATILSKSFWQNHALIAGTRAIRSKTITKSCPY